MRVYRDTAGVAHLWLQTALLGEEIIVLHIPLSGQTQVLLTPFKSWYWSANGECFYPIMYEDLNQVELRLFEALCHEHMDKWRNAWTHSQELLEV
jgi:hypothetical protein